MLKALLKILTQIFSRSPEPPWMLEARKVMGMHERKNYQELYRWLRSDGATLGDPRELPWCGDFVQTAIANALPGEIIPENPYLARNWCNFGRHCTPRFGSVLVFWRGAPKGYKGHVGFYVGEDDETFSVLGGNQGNTVCVTRIKKSRLLDSRWPYKHPCNTKPRRIRTDCAVSKDEE